jgi:hypothetical protein
MYDCQDGNNYGAYCMSSRQRYRKKANQFVIAVPLDLDTEGFAYRKWGSEQRCKRGDWLVDNNGEVYTVDAAVFAETYRRIDTGKYVKPTTVWAEPIPCAGNVRTKEGTTHYAKGDYLVSNDVAGTDSYAIDASKFEAMYELDE